MKEPDAARIERHNRLQRGYFEVGTKRTMLPAATPYVSRQVDALLAFAGYRAGERVLDVGCGMGRYTIPLVRRGVAVEGLDLSPVLLEYLRDRTGDDVPVHCGDVLDLASELAGRFDRVVGFFTLHHLHELGASFAAMREMLRPGGRLTFLEPNPLNPLYYVQIAVTPGIRWEAERGLLRLRPAQVFAELRAAGFARPAVRRFGAFPPFVANLRGAGAVERALERVPLWRPLLPFQLFGADRG